MKIVFYSSSTNEYDASAFHYMAYPACCSQLEELAAAHSEHEFAVVARLPAFFLVDLENDGSFTRKAHGVEYVLLDAAGTAFETAGCDRQAVSADKAPAAFASEADAADKTLSAVKACGATSASGTSVSGKALSADTAPAAFEAFAAAIAALSPDIAIAATCWMTPFDWLPLEDALIAEKLSENGIRTLCHSTVSAEICFDKRLARAFFKEHHFPAPESLFLDHSLFWAGRGRSEFVVNPYKERLFSQLEKLHYPVVIKDTTGLSSFGMDVVNSPKAARSILESRKTSGDRLIEEYAAGDQFGVEVYGMPGSYYVMSPFLFSVTQYGITSPKQSVKLSVSGDEAETRFHLADMRRLVTDMAEALELRGAAQFDLVFRGAECLESGQEPACRYGGWTVIEINPRLSGLTAPTAVLAGKSAPELLLETACLESGQEPACGATPEKRAASLESGLEPACGATPEKRAACLESGNEHACGEVSEKRAAYFESGNEHAFKRAPACVLDVKLTVLAEKRFKQLCALPYVYAVNQTVNDAARQNRERGYCEVVLGAETASALLERLDELKVMFPEELDDAFVESARELCGKYV